VNIRVKALLLAGLLKLKGIKKKTGEGRRSLCLGEGDVEHILLHCLGIRNLRIRSSNKQSFCKNKEVAYKKITLYRKNFEDN
jgi:hypothetical protein